MRWIPLVLLLVYELSNNLQATDQTHGQASGLSWTSQTAIARPVPSEDSLEAWYNFTNDSSQPMRIKAVKAPCDCIVTQADKTVYYPGESGLIMVEIDRSRKQAPFRETIRVAASHPDTPDAPSTFFELVLIAE